MEKLLVLSDMHGRPSAAVKAIEMHPECGTVIFLGDGTRHADCLRAAAPHAAFVCVRGNCDSFLNGEFPEEALFSVGAHTIFVCHGHTRFVKSGTDNLLCAAKARGADIALYGHTHLPHEEYDGESGVYLFNPGSIGAPRDGSPTYGLLTLDGKNVLFSVGEI